MPVHTLTAYVEADLAFGRGETPAFRLNFTNTTAEQVAGWTIDAPIRRAARMTPLASWTVTIDGTTARFTLPATVTEQLPDDTSYTVRVATAPDAVRVPIGGRLLLDRTTVAAA